MQALLAVLAVLALGSPCAAAPRARKAAPAAPEAAAQPRLFNAPAPAWGPALQVFYKTEKFRQLGLEPLAAKNIPPLVHQLQAKGLTPDLALARLGREPLIYLEAQRAAREQVESMATAALSIPSEGDMLRDKAAMVKELLIYDDLIPELAPRLKTVSKQMQAELKRLRTEAKNRVVESVTVRAAALSVEAPASEPAPVAAAPAPADNASPEVGRDSSLPLAEKVWTDDTARAKALLADLANAQSRESRKAVAAQLQAIVDGGTRLETSMTILDGLWRQQPGPDDADPETVYETLEAVGQRLGTPQIAEESVRRIRAHAERSLHRPGAAPSAAEVRALAAITRVEAAATAALVPPAPGARTPLLEQGRAAYAEQPGTVAAYIVVGTLSLLVAVFVALWSNSQAGYFAALAAAPALYYGALKSLWHKHPWTGYSLALAIGLLAMGAAKAAALGHWSVWALVPAMAAASWITARASSRHSPEIAVAANLIAALGGAMAFLALGPLPLLR